jgi:hypothetical protein
LRRDFEDCLRAEVAVRKVALDGPELVASYGVLDG